MRTSLSPYPRAVVDDPFHPFQEPAAVQHRVPPPRHDAVVPRRPGPGGTRLPVTGCQLCLKRRWVRWVMTCFTTWRASVHYTNDPRGGLAGYARRITRFHSTQEMGVEWGTRGGSRGGSTQFMTWQQSSQRLTSNGGRWCCPCAFREMSTPVSCSVKTTAGN